MTKEELQNMADTYGLYTEEDVENRISCRLLAVGARNEELEKENAELKEKVKWYSEQVCFKECAEVWGEAKEIIRKLLDFVVYDSSNLDAVNVRAKAEQFLKENK